MAKTIGAPSLQEVNDNLLSRLNSLINDADDEQLLNLTEALAKLNSSYKGNSNFSAPESEDERLAREQKDVLMEALKKGPTSDIAEGEII